MLFQDVVIFLPVSNFSKFRLKVNGPLTILCVIFGWKSDNKDSLLILGLANTDDNLYAKNIKKFISNLTTLIFLATL